VSTRSPNRVWRELAQCDARGAAGISVMSRAGSDSGTKRDAAAIAVGIGDQFVLRP